MLKKLSTSVFIIVISIIAASAFGIIHDQITYTISYEYYTENKFQQFGLDFDGDIRNRWLVTIVGIIATWWVGLISGSIFALLSLFFKSHKNMLYYSIKAILITLFVTVFFSIGGYFYGKFVVLNSPTLMNIYSYKDFENFIIVETIHKFSYAGGLIGSIAGSFYIIRKTFLNTKKH